MIGSLRGKVLDRLGEGELLFEVQGVGYRVTVSPATAVQLAMSPGEGEVFLHVYHHIREDSQTLYGFENRDERVCFETLLGAHGVGPALALAILAVHDPVTLASVLAADDVGALCLVPGVGRKTAARLMIELKSRLDLDDLASASVSNRAAGTAPGSGSAAPLTDVREALIELGYGPDEVAAAVRDLPSGDDRGTLLKQALQRLAVR